ncbi:MAG: hypothetical protein HYT78_12545 [Deltaproteobacteria bacterium]|nr:hypothetical protein [Deltaproteobacteria bacterium]
MQTLKIDDHIEFHPKAFVRKRLFEMEELSSTFPSTHPTKSSTPERPT